MAFAIIYFVWGSTYLAIRVGVREIPPFLLAALRFLIAGAALYGWMMAQGAPPPSGRQWGSAFLLGLPVFVLDYGLLFWAEQRVPSGLAAVMLATIPLFMALWLIHHVSLTKVGTYAYVNPVVAVVLGYALAGEALSRRTPPRDLRCADALRSHFANFFCLCSGSIFYKLCSGFFPFFSQLFGTGFNQFFRAAFNRALAAQRRNIESGVNRAYRHAAYRHRNFHRFPTPGVVHDHQLVAAPESFSVKERIANGAPKTVAIRVSIAQWIIEAIAVTIIALRIGKVWESPCPPE